MMRALEDLTFAAALALGFWGRRHRDGRRGG